MGFWDSVPPIETRFFHATEPFLKFWQRLVNDVAVIEVGAGCCDFTKEMHELGIRAMAIEPRANDDVRIECANFLYPTDVESCAFLERFDGIVVAARPDHSGWFARLPDLALNARIFYIGLEMNFDMDIPWDYDYDILFEDAGKDGELLLEIK